MNIKRIIKEELSKILEGDVIRPKFGGHDDDEDVDDGKKSSHHYLDILEKVGNTLKDFIDSMADEMGESEVANLNDLLDKIEDMQSEASEYENDFEEDDDFEDDDTSSGLSGFKDYMGRFDRGETD